MQTKALWYHGIAQVRAGAAAIVNQEAGVVRRRRKARLRACGEASGAWTDVRHVCRQGRRTAYACVRVDLGECHARKSVG